MSQFELLMDDMKDALQLSWRNKKIFWPAMIANIIFLVLMIVIVVGVVVAMGGMIFTIASTINDPNSFSNLGGVGAIIGFIILFFIIMLITSLLFLAIELGINSLIIAVLDGEPISKQVFFDGIKQYIVKVFFTNILLSIIYIIGFIILSIPIVIYAGTVGILSGGWGFIFLGILFQTLLGYWVLILMNDGGGAFESVGKNIRYGKKHFKIMAFLLFLQAMFLSGFAFNSGIGAIGLITLFVNYAVMTYFRMVILKTYRRLKLDMNETIADI